MIPCADDCTFFRFSTAALPHSQRGEAICQLYERIPFPGKIEPLEPLAGRLPSVDIVKRALPGLEFVTGVLGGVCQRARPEGQPHTGHDEFFIWLSIAGASTVCQGGEELTAQDGDAFVTTRGRTGFAMFSPNRVRFIGMRMPRAALCPLVEDLDTGSLRALPRDTPALKLLSRYVTGVATESGSLGRETARAFATHIYDLVALAIGATPNGTMIAESRGLRAARLHKIKHDIGANVRDCELNIASVAARHGITPRYVHKLFESEGVTFAEYLRSERLALAYRMLTDARLADLSVSSIAYEAGFGDLSNFNHLFRRRYSATPSDVRKSNYPRR
jgi:AraC-like DNA-binding protein